MNRGKIWRHVCRFLVVLVLALLPCCNSGSVVQSDWQKDAMVLDGTLSAWDGRINADPENHFGMGIANDDSALYLCLVSDKESIVHQVMHAGLTVWFQSGKSNRGRWGIRFPLGMAAARVDFRQFADRG